MKGLKFLVAFLVFLVSFAALAQTTPAPVAPAPKLPAFEVGVDIGQLATATAGNLQQSQVKFEMNLGASFRWFPVEKFAVGVGFTTSTVKLSGWLVNHNFITPKPLVAYNYTAADFSVYYYPLRTAKGDLWVGLDTTAYFAPQNATTGTKIGYGASFGGDYNLGKGFGIGAYVRYRHVQDFLVPIANVVEPGVRVVFRF